MADKDTMTFWGSTETPTTPRLKRRFGSYPRSITQISTMRPAPSRSSRTSTRPTRCSPIRKSVRRMINMVPPMARKASVRRWPRLLRFSGGGGQGFGFDDIFSQFFGGGQQQTASSPRQGADLQYRMDLSFKEAVFGKDTKISYDRSAQCHTCGGSGAKPGTSR